jgi:hypothetical protein
VSTIPLAPGGPALHDAVGHQEIEASGAEDNLRTRKTESSDTTRADAQIVKKAQEKTDFNLTAKETFGDEAMSISRRRARWQFNQRL